MPPINRPAEREPAPLRDQLAQAIARLTWGGARQFAASLAPFGLTLPQYFALAAVNRVGACTMGTLADRTHHTLGTTTGIVDRLVRHGLVARRPHATDRRVVTVRLTPGGRETLARVEDMRRERLDTAVAALGAAGARELGRLLGRYAAAMGIDAADGAYRNMPRNALEPDKTIPTGG